MSELLESTTSDPLTLSAAGSHARTSANPTTEEPDLTAGGLDCGSNFIESSTSFDRDTQSWRTYLQSLFEDWTEFSEVFPRSGSMRSGKLYPQEPLALLTPDPGFSLWPTPQASDAKRMQFSREAHLKHQARNQRLGFGSGPAGLNLVAHCQVEFGGVPTANFAEWLMGFPINWTATECSATPSFHKSQSGSDEGS